MLSEYLLHLNLKPASGAPPPPHLPPQTLSWKVAEKLTVKHPRCCRQSPAPDTGCKGKTKTRQLPLKGWQSRGRQDPRTQNKQAWGSVFNDTTRWRAEQLSQQFRQAYYWEKGWKKFVLFLLRTKGLGQPREAQVVGSTRPGFWPVFYDLRQNPGATFWSQYHQGLK